MAENKHTIGDLKQMQSLPLSAKITMTKRRIYDWYDYWQGDVYLSFSGGKDSTVLKHIIDGMELDIPSVFVNTGLEYPEIQKFAMSQPNVTTVRPEKMFPEVVKTYGYPVISKNVSHTIRFSRKGGEECHSYKKLMGDLEHNGKKSIYCMDKYAYLYDAPFQISERCCDILKKNPFHKYERETGRKPIVATMAEESRLRLDKWLRNGCNAFDRRSPMSSPISFWTEQDILHYLKEHDVPYCKEIYGDIVEKGECANQVSLFDSIDQLSGKDLTTTGEKRTGCMFCMFGCHREKNPNRFERMKETHPRQYEYCIGGGEFVDGMWQPNKEGLGLGFVLDYIGVKY